MSRACKDYRTYQNTLSRLRRAGFFEDEENAKLVRAEAHRDAIAADRAKAAKRLPPAVAPNAKPAPVAPTPVPAMAVFTPAAPEPASAPTNGHSNGRAATSAGGVAEQMTLVMELIQQVMQEGELTQDNANALMALLAEAVAGGDMYTVTEWVTPDLARDFLARPLPVLEDGTPLIQRSRVDPHVDWLAGIIERDEWMTTPQGIILAPGGPMLDGQHRCYAIIKTNKPVLMRITYNCPPKVFLALDQNRRRTTADNLKMTGHTDTNNLGSALRLLFAVREFDKNPTGAAMLPKNWSRLRPTDYQLTALKKQVGEEALKVHVTAGTALAKGFDGIPASAIVFRITAVEAWPRGIDQLNEFCAMLRDGAGPGWGADHPAHTVREWLLKHSRKREAGKRELQFAALRKGWANMAHGETLGGISASTDMPMVASYHPDNPKSFPARKRAVRAKAA